MKQLILILVALFPLYLFGQYQYTIHDFSEKYFGKLVILEGSEKDLEKKGSISIYSKSTQKELVHLESESLIFDLDGKGEVKTNVVELPYGEQSILISQDFNFDGNKDIAIMDGLNSCYHGPSFQVYLEQSGELTHSPEFTRLAQEYCGMFQVDSRTKSIHTSVKSGCCWHEYSTFKVVNNIPKPILIKEEDATEFPFYTLKVQSWQSDKKTEFIKKTLDLTGEGISVIMSFQLEKSKKKLLLFTINNRTLNYALLKEDGLVEFNYPLETVYQNPDFNINDSADLLMFSNGSASYQVYENRKNGSSQEIGILVQVNGKNYDQKGDIHTLKGSLKGIKAVSLDNVIDK